MPCSDGGPTLAQERHDKLDLVTRLLCEHMSQIKGPSAELKVWWHRHQIEDAEREGRDAEIAKENARRQLRQYEAKAELHERELNQVRLRIAEIKGGLK